MRLRICCHAVAAGVALILLAGPVSAGCAYPKAPGAFPDGTSASLEEMLAAKKIVQQYMSDMADYLKCIDDEAPKADPAKQLDEKQKKELAKAIDAADKKHNAAVADQEAVADRFNVQLRAFKAKQAPKN